MRTRAKNAARKQSDRGKFHLLLFFEGPGHKVNNLRFYASGGGGRGDKRMTKSRWNFNGTRRMCVFSQPHDRYVRHGYSAHCRHMHGRHGLSRAVVCWGFTIFPASKICYHPKHRRTHTTRVCDAGHYYIMESKGKSRERATLSRSPHISRIGSTRSSPYISISWTRDVSKHMRDLALEQRQSSLSIIVCVKGVQSQIDCRTLLIFGNQNWQTFSAHLLTTFNI